MTAATAIEQSTTSHAPVSGQEREKPYFDLPLRVWLFPLFYLLGMALTGLRFYPALLLLILSWIWSLKNDRYHLIIQLTLFFGGYAFFHTERLLPVWTTDMAMGLSLVLWLIYRKPPVLWKVLIAIACYVLALVILSMFSLEKFSIQILMMRRYLAIVYIIVPVALFSGKEFRMDVFFTKLMPYALLICLFYIIDAVVIAGDIFVPETTAYHQSTFYDPYIVGPGHILRKYPPGFFFVALILFPITRYYKLRVWQLLLFIFGLAVTQTFTVIMGYLAGFILFQNSRKRIFGYCIGGVFMLVALYGLDCILPEKHKEEGVVESTLRIKSSIDQFTILANAVDDEDLAKFGSQRMAQIIPKVEVLLHEHRELTGLGFLHPDKTKITRYIIENELYTDIANNIEVTAFVEVAGVQVFLNIGIIGLIIHLAFFIWLYFIIRKLPYSAYYLCVMIMLICFGFGGFGGLIQEKTLLILSLAYATIILNSREQLGFRCPWLRD